VLSPSSTEIPRSRTRVSFSWDIRGHGASRPLDGAFDIADVVEDLKAIMESNGVERAVMLGRSMGTYVGQEMTFHQPDLVSALVVIDGTCITADPGWLGRRFDELSKDEYVKIMDGVDRCIHPEPDYRTPDPTLLLVGEHDQTGDIRKSMAVWPSVSRTTSTT
jgi:hypothetical protein